MLILIWGLGVIGVFTWIYNKLHFSPKIIRYFTAGALSFISFFIVFISWPVGIFRFATLVDTWKKMEWGKAVKDSLFTKILIWALVFIAVVLVIIRLYMGSAKILSVLLAALILAPFSFYPKHDSDNSKDVNQTSARVDEAKTSTQSSVLSESEQEENNNANINIAEHLVNIGLAYIGRKTKTANPCITPAQTEERQSIERPFLKLLADNYNDEATRKILAQYFMLYKEMLLFLIYAMALKKNPVLHSEVKGKLKERMSEGLSPEAIKKRNDYWRELSRTFYESDKGTQDIGHVLEAVFWDKLPKKVKSIPKCGHDSLYTIFCYISKAIAREYQTA